jgi:hypothetical protein
MKPTEVALIDLGGDSIVLKQPVNGTSPTWFRDERPLKIVGTTESRPVSFYNFMEARFDSLSGQEPLVGLFIKHKSDSYGGYYTDYEDYDYHLEPLRLFLNDQLTFIRNGMWETLAIYQATLGRYWEVPVYERDSQAQHYYIPLIDGYKFEKDRLILTRVFSKDRLNLFQPSFQDFIQFYNSVFSQLAPWKGESTDV